MGRVSLGFSIYIWRPPLGPAWGHPPEGCAAPFPLDTLRGRCLPRPSAKPAPLLRCKAAMHGGKPVGCEGRLSAGRGGVGRQPGLGGQRCQLPVTLDMSPPAPTPCWP